MDLPSAMTCDGMCNHDQLHEDASAVSAARNGDTAAFDVLATKHRRRILNVVRRITDSFDDAEDVTQNALLKAYLNIGGFKGACSFSSWLTRIAINEALMWKRRPVRRAEVSWSNSPNLDEFGLDPQFAHKGPNPEECYTAQEQAHIFVAALNGLKPVMREAVESCDLKECSMKDLALMQGTSLSAAKARLFRGRRQLRTRLEYLLRRKASNDVRSKSRPCIQESAATP